MLEVNLFDREFIHTENLLGYITCSDRRKPTKLKWINGLLEFDGITVFTERYLDDPIVDKVKSRLKIFWLLEPRAVHPYEYNRIIELENKFDYILTYDTHLLSRGPKYIKYVVAQSRVDNPFIAPKSKMVSMIASNKTMTEGHRFRHSLAQKFSNKFNIDMWGSGYKTFTSKNDPLMDYYFSISVMNCKVDNFFTEVLVDNFMLGTVPIFWGCPNIDEYFDPRGIITFNTEEDLNNILNNLNVDDYTSRLEFIEKNFIIAHEYVSTDDIFADVLKTL